MTTLIDSSNGVRVALHDLGGSGPQLLILHATGFHGRCYRAVADHLSDRFHVWAPDLRGHGDSITPADTDLGWGSMADDVLAVSEHLGVDSWAVAGHSMGGAVAAKTACLHPHLIAAAWVFEPAIFPVNAERRGNDLAQSARFRRHHFESFDEAIERYANAAPFAKVSRDVIGDYVYHGFVETDTGITLKTSGETEARVFEGADLELFEQIRSVSVPFTIANSLDGSPPSQIAELVADQLPNTRQLLWPDNTHFGPFEDPARAAAEILEAVG
ncbi:MAG: alpha/beta hydrolase [Acidimicrobiaceae bacterium]|nr:alpha/beta hydrolase [Acidimicrobiaceae bacterium]MDE0607090.1 alpha/beta hydrolase [Acidimicrobiaceae bacterium]